uniref:C2H2-type domain-containing protein n=1 Tax=Bracon brevicornis TaxID=1563983 RepID=A0A6V7HNL5_9HYME
MAMSRSAMMSFNGSGMSNENNQEVDEMDECGGSNNFDESSYVRMCSPSISPDVIESNPGPSNNAPISNNIDCTNPPEYNVFDERMAAIEYANVDNVAELTFAQCKICGNILIADFTHIDRHKKSESHVKLQMLLSSSQRREMQQESMFNFFFHERNYVIESIVAECIYLMKVLKVTSETKCLFYWCDMCSTDFYCYPNDHQLSDTHLRLLHGIKDKENSSYLTCETCEGAEFDRTSGIMNHIKSPIHLTSLQFNTRALPHSATISGEPSLQWAFTDLASGQSQSISPYHSIFAASYNGIDCSSQMPNGWELIRVKQYFAFHSHQTLPEGLETYTQRTLICTICHCLLEGYESIGEHIKTIDHITRGPCVIQKKSHGCYYCEVCKFMCPRTVLLDHLTGPTHSMMKEDKYPTPPEIMSMRFYSLPEGIVRLENDSHFVCQVCNKKITGTLEHATDHAQTPTHKKKLRGALQNERERAQYFEISEWNSFEISTYTDTNDNNSSKKRSSAKPDGREFTCSFCDTTVASISGFHAHLAKHISLEGIAHANNEKSKTSTDGPSIAWQGNISSSNERESEDEMPDKPISVEFTSRPVKTKPVVPYRSWERKEPDCDLEDGVNIYEVDEQKRKKFELSVALFFIDDSESSLYCMVCRKTVKYSIQILYEHFFNTYHMTTLQQMLEDDHMFKDYPDEFSDLALGYEYMEEVDDASVRCYACKTFEINENSCLKRHIENPEHITAKTAHNEQVKLRFKSLSSFMDCNFYCVRYYWCVICQVNFTRECDFQKHINGLMHIGQTAQYVNSNVRLLFDYCASCGVLWYGFAETFNYHSKGRMHKYHSYRNSYRITELPASVECFLRSAEQYANQVIAEIDDQQEETAMKNRTAMDDLETICKIRYSDCVAYSYGSSVTGLGGIYSDLEIFLDCDPDFFIYEFNIVSTLQAVERIKAINRYADKNPEIWLVNDVKMDARIPIIKLTHRPTASVCNVSFNDRLPVEIARLVKRYCEVFPNCRKMIIFIKKWMIRCDINDISTDIITWMVIFFLQRKGILPTVAQLIKQKGESRLIAGWETGVDLNFKILNDPKLPMAKLLSEFFGFFADFDYRNNVICPLLGRPIAKKAFQFVEVPTEMNHYIRYLDTLSNPEPFRIDSVMCIQNPFDLSHNIAETVKKLIVYRFKTFCALSMPILKKRRCTVAESVERWIAAKNLQADSDSSS